MLALDLYEKALLDYHMLVVFSGDSDIIPAITKAQKNGSKVVAILGENQPAKLVREHVDSVLPLESVLRLLPNKSVIKR